MVLEMGRQEALDRVTDGDVAARRVEAEPVRVVGRQAIGERARPLDAARDVVEQVADGPAAIGVDPGQTRGVAGDPARATALRGVKLLDLKILVALDDIKAARKAALSAVVPTETLLSRLWRWVFG